MIRRYEDRDFADIAWLNQVSYAKPCTEKELRATLDSGKCWVWEDSPVVVGAIILDGNFVWSVMVARNWQGKGIGGSLLKEAEKSVLPLFLHTEPEGQAIHLYRKLGYVTVCKEEKFYGDKDAVLMVKRNVDLEAKAR